jgi:hypothetical protein
VISCNTPLSGTITPPEAGEDEGDPEPISFTVTAADACCGDSVPLHIHQEGQADRQDRVLRRRRGWYDHHHLEFGRRRYVHHVDGASRRLLRKRQHLRRQRVRCACRQASEVTGFVLVNEEAGKWSGQAVCGSLELEMPGTDGSLTQEGSTKERKHSSTSISPEAPVPDLVSLDVHLVRFQHAGPCIPARPSNVWIGSLAAGCDFGGTP